MLDRKSCGKYLRTRKTLDIEVDELQQQKMTSHPVLGNTKAQDHRNRIVDDRKNIAWSFPDPQLSSFDECEFVVFNVFF